MATNIKTIQDPNTPKYNATSGLLTDYGKYLGLSEVNFPMPSNLNTMSADRATSSGITTPIPSPYTYAGMAGATEAIPAQAKSDAQKEVDAAKTASDNSLNEYMKAIVESGSISSSVDRAAEDAARKESDKYLAQLEQEQLANRRAIEKLQKENPTGMLSTGVNDAIDRQNRKSLSSQADIAILQTAANRNYDTAKSIADRQVEMNLEMNLAKTEALKTFYEVNHEYFTTKEKRLYEEQIKKQDAEDKKKLDNENAIRDIKLQIAQSQDPNKASIINQLSQIDTSQDGAFDKVTALLGQVKDPAVKLDLAIKNQQLIKLQQENTIFKLYGGLSPTEYNKQIEDNNKKIIAETTAQKTAIEDGLLLDQSISQIDAVLNSSALNSVVGSNPFSRGVIRQKGFFSKSLSAITSIGSSGTLAEITGKADDTVALTQQMLDQQFLDKLIAVKSKGATFGALSDNEGNALRNAANAIASTAIKTGNNVKGNLRVVGYDMSEAEFRKQMGIIQETMRRARERATGEVFSSEEQKLLDGIYGADTVLDPSNYY